MVPDFHNAKYNTIDAQSLQYLSYLALFVCELRYQKKGDKMAQTIHLLCGVPGSGKTWVATQLSKFNWVPHDDHDVDKYHNEIIREAKRSDKPILAEAPFRISTLIGQLKNAGFKVKTYYVTAPEKVVRDRYQKRSKKPFPKQHATNLRRYDSKKWDVRGTSTQIFDELKKVQDSV